MARARKKAAALETSDDRPHKPVLEAVEDFLAHCKSQNLTGATIHKYKNPLMKLATYCEDEAIEDLEELRTEKLDAFRADRKLAPITAAKELEIFRVFIGFCQDRGWVRENVARKIKMPRNLKPNEVVPFTLDEIAAILKHRQHPVRCLRTTAGVDHL